MDNFESMNRQLIERIQSADLDENIKKIIGQSLKQLSNYEEQQIGKIRDSIKETIPDFLQWSAYWNITTAVVPQKNLDEWEEKYFYPVEQQSLGFASPQWDFNFFEGCNEDCYTEVIGNYGHRQFFWRGTYDELQDEISHANIYKGIAVDKDGQEHPFFYKLVLEPACRRKEERLYQLAALYHIQRPVIFSPFARRQLTIFLTDINMTAESFFDDKCRWDFCWEKNGLQNKIIENCELIWNLKMLPFEDDIIEGEQIPEVNTGGTEFRFTESDNVQQGTFLQLQHMEEEPVMTDIVKKSENQIILRTFDTSQTKINGVRIENVEDTPTYSFTNQYELALMIPPRILSVADVERTLYRYRSDSFICGQPSLRKPNVGKMIRGYRVEDMYGGRREVSLYQRKRLQSLPPCYIFFATQQQAPEWVKKYLQDYACYVLADIQWRFPDFSWVGVSM